MDIRNFKIKNIPAYLKNLRGQKKLFRYILGNFLQLTGLYRLITFRINESKIVFSKSAMGLGIFVDKKEYLEDCNRFTSFIKDGDLVVDVGANIGFLAIAAAQKNKQGTVIAVEPHPRTFGFLTENIQKNKLSNIKYYNLAIGEKTGEINFSNFSNDDLNHVIGEGEGIKVKMVTLDELLEPLFGDHIALLKIDVEGYEKFVLQGAKNTLRKTSAIYIEIWDGNFAPFGYLSSDIIRQLESEDFKVYKINDDEQIESIRAPFVPEKCMNILALKDAASFSKNTGYIISMAGN